MQRIVLNRSGGDIVIGRLQDYAELCVGPPFVLLLPATTLDELRESERIAKDALLSEQCLEFCTFGRFAEQLHDFIDDLLDGYENGGLLTSDHRSVNEAAEYLVHCAGANEGRLLALVEQHPVLVQCLEREAQIFNADH